MDQTITITAPNSAVGVPTSDDGVMGMVIRGVAVAGQLVLDTPILLTQLADAANYGINAAYDVTNNTAVYQQIQEFYSQAGDGALLWIQVTAIANAFATYVSSVAYTDFVMYSAQADPTQQFKIVGLCYNIPSALQSSTDFPADVPATVTAAHTQQQIMFQAGYCYGTIVDGYNMSSTVTAETIGTQATNTAFSVSLCITGTKGNGVSAVGLALGKYARISIGRGVGAVADGAINTTTAFLTNSIAIPGGGTIVVGDNYLVAGGTVLYNGATYATGSVVTAVTGHTTFTTADTGYLILNASSVLSFSPTDIKSLATKQYFFITKVQNISGLYWNDGATCTAASNFFSQMPYNRVINSLSYDARAYCTTFKGLNLPTDLTTGNLDPVFCAANNKSFYTDYISPLTAAAGTGDITDGSMTFSGPNFASNATMLFKLVAVRSTILGPIVGTVQFALTL